MAMEGQARKVEAYQAAVGYGHALRLLFEPARARGASQRTLAKAVGRDASVVSRYFSGDTVAPHLFVDRMVNYLKTLKVPVTDQEVRQVHALRRAAQKLSDQSEARFEYLEEHIALLHRQMEQRKAQFSEDQRRLRNERDALVRGREVDAEALAALEAEQSARAEELSVALAAAADEVVELRDDLGIFKARAVEARIGRKAAAELVVRQQRQLEHAQQYTRELESDLATASAALQALEQEVRVLRRQVALFMDEPHPSGTGDAVGTTQTRAGEHHYRSADAAPSSPPDTGSRAAARHGDGPRFEAHPRSGAGCGSGAGAGGTQVPATSEDPAGKPSHITRAAYAPGMVSRTEETDSAGQVCMRSRRRLLALVLAVLACASFLFWRLGDQTIGDVLPWIDKATAASSTPSTSPTLSKDPVLSIGAESINTLQVLALPVCSNENNVLVSVFPPVQVSVGTEVRVDVVMTGEGEPCRVDLSRQSGPLSLTVTDAAGKTVWSSNNCAPREIWRWARLDYHRIYVTFIWDQSISTATCPTSAQQVPAGTYHLEVNSGRGANDPMPSSLVIH
ncbi:hypothetical protein ACGFX2_38925 [Streptomyces goshikiensis]|uniref:hypothetical protein n=1 Tax=Streptomyces goshikiensis TaxID=1942 RepID=UPI00370FC7F2